jgi:soluble lytic murein transglycosylase-like protein
MGEALERDRRGRTLLSIFPRPTTVAYTNPPSFLAMACAVETASIASLHFGAAALIIATVMPSTLAADRTASPEPPPPMMYREGSSAADPFAEFVAEASRRFGVATSWIHAARQAESGGEVHALSPEGAMGLLIAHLVSEAIVAYQHVSSRGVKGTGSCKSTLD